MNIYNKGKSICQHTNATNVINHFIENHAKEKMSVARLAYLGKNINKSWSYGHSGKYDSIWFDSALELAYYVYHKEVLNTTIFRNRTTALPYDYKGCTKHFVPDFIDDNGTLYEIKDTLKCDYDDKTSYKMEQCSDVVFLFKKDIKDYIDYCVDKYGKAYHITLYEKEKH